MGALDHPPGLARTRAIMRGSRSATIGEQPLGPVPVTAPQSAHARDRVEQRNHLVDVEDDTDAGAGGGTAARTVASAPAGHRRRSIERAGPDMARNQATSKPGLPWSARFCWRQRTCSPAVAARPRGPREVIGTTVPAKQVAASGAATPATAVLSRPSRARASAEERCPRPRRSPRQVGTALPGHVNGSSLTGVRRSRSHGPGVTGALHRGDVDRVSGAATG